MNSDNVTLLMTNTIDIVGMILSFAGAVSAIGWTVLGARYLDGIARQPELMAMMRVQVLVVGGLMESFPFIIFATGMWFVTANPFVGAAISAMKAVNGG
ncbi:ATP synthase subunit c [Gammaproteobacteria bacterium]